MAVRANEWPLSRERVFPDLCYVSWEAEERYHYCLFFSATRDEKHYQISLSAVMSTGFCTLTTAFPYRICADFTGKGDKIICYPGITLPKGPPCKEERRSFFVLHSTRPFYLGSSGPGGSEEMRFFSRFISCLLGSERVISLLPPFLGNSR